MNSSTHSQNDAHDLREEKSAGHLHAIDSRGCKNENEGAIKQIGKKGVIFSLLLAALIVIVSVGFAQELTSSSGLLVDGTKLGLETAVAIPHHGSPAAVKSGEDAAYYIVTLTDPPLAAHLSAATAAPDDAASQDYLRYLADRQAELLDAITQLAGDTAVIHQYRYAANGVAVKLQPEQAAKVAALPGVLRVQRNFARQPMTDAGPHWIGADAIWDGTATGGEPGFKGEGVIIGVIDTGINMDHPSFADVGGDGYDHENPFGAGVYVGWCDPAHPDFDPNLVCNDKLIGVYSYANSGGDPEDDDGHGSHTASTAAGNVIPDAELIAPTTSITAEISGVAPHANIISYDACGVYGCDLIDLVAAIDQAVADGVDVIDYAIGGGSGDPWTDADSLALLNALNVGIVPVTAAGKSGPDAGTIGSPANAPWLLSVGATTHNRVFGNSLVGITADGSSLPNIAGKGFTAGYGPAPIVYAGDFGDALCLNPFPAGTWNGEIVVCDRGSIPRIMKGENVLAGGAGGLVLANDAANGDSLVSDEHVLPAVNITFDDGVVLEAWLAAASNPAATISGMTADYSAANGDIIADFSARGPDSQVDVIKPDVMAPGVNIWAAVDTDGAAPSPEYGLLSGTSMSSAHAAGAAALLRGLHPDWSAAEIKSALMMTAWSALSTESAASSADPFSRGSGRIDLTHAGETGLVMNETAANFLFADPAVGGDPTTLNVAGMANSQCVGVCEWTRSVRSALTTYATWQTAVIAPRGMIVTVSPSEFILAPGVTQALTITVDASNAPADSWSFATIVLVNVEGLAPTVRLPVAVKPMMGNLPEQVDVAARRDAGSTRLTGLQTIEITDLTVDAAGLVPATQELLSLSQDPTNDDPYDNLNDGTTYFVTVSIPDGAARLTAETFESEAPDLDLYVGVGEQPSADTEVCASRGETAVEQCNVNNPEAGTWWILVQNYAESDTPPDAATLAYAVVAGDAGNLTVEAPSNVPPYEPFDLLIFWDEEAMAAGDIWYGAFSLGSDPDNPGNVGMVNVDLDRLEDDVTMGVDVETAVPGDTLTYTISIQPNITPEDLTYTMTNVIPDGLTLVKGSVTATGGHVEVISNTLSWTGIMSISDFTYEMATSETDSACAAPLSELDGDSDAYIDLAAFGILPDPNTFGDNVWFSVDFDGGAYDFFGSYQDDLLNFTDDGFVFFAPSTPGAAPWQPQPIPTASDPNNLLAIFWRDMEIVYDGVRGVSLANLTSDGYPTAGIIEFDDVEDWPADGGPTYDFEIVAYYQASPDRYEYIFAYDNLTGPTALGAIGLENASGTFGVQYGFNDLVLTDGMAICFDLVPAYHDPVQISYEATVDADAAGVIANQTAHNTDNPGSKEAIASAEVTVLETEAPLYLSSNSSGAAGGVTYQDEDIVVYDMISGEWAMLFDGSDVGLANLADIDAVHMMDDGDILMSFRRRTFIPDVGWVYGPDIVRFMPDSLGEDTAGSFEVFFDGSDVGLLGQHEDVDAIGFAPDGRLVVSTYAHFTVSQLDGSHLRGDNDDLIIFNAISLGEDTQGDWEFYFDGSDVWDFTEDVWGTWLDAATGDIYFSMQDEFIAGDISGDALDVFICHPESLGDDTACTFEMYFDGSEAGFGGDRIDGFSR